MTTGITPALFDFIDELTQGISEEELDRDEVVEQDSTALTFCEGLFDQFFGTIGLSIGGFSQSQKKMAGNRAEDLRADQSAETGHVRWVIALYEKFCDMYDDLQSDYGNEVVAITYAEFHTDYLTDLLDAVHDWAVAEGEGSLAERIEQARTGYHQAIENSAWLTKTKSASAWWKRI